MSKLKRFLLRLLLLFGVSLAITFGSLLIVSPGWIDAVHLDIYTGDTDLRDTILWGYPEPFVADHPYNSGAGQIDSNDIFQVFEFLFCWIVWLGRVGMVYLLLIAGTWTVKKLARSK